MLQEVPRRTGRFISLTSCGCGILIAEVCAAVEDLNRLLDVLTSGLWNPLTEHQIAGHPFQLMDVPVKQTRAGLHRYALLRQQEIEGFMDGLFGPHEEMDLPESAGDAVGILGKVRAFLTGVITLLDNPGQPAGNDDLAGMSENLQALAIVAEKEMNTVLLSCTRARKQATATHFNRSGV
jgi:hypothetical protein